MAQLQPGDILDGRYRIDTPIARGGMSTVYRCIDLRLGRSVAAKVLDETYAQDAVFRTRFRREARSMAQLQHPCLVNVYDTSSTGEHVFLIMELITGGTLRELLAERGPMPPHAATAVLRQALTGLAEAHRAGMIHRDIKPDNVLINRDHQVKLADFGLVRGTAREATPEDTIMGTAAYLAPEQIQGTTLTPAADVYAAGVVLYELLTGETPFRGATAKDVAYARLTHDVPAPSTAIDGVPPEFDELVACATARDPQDRYADADEFLLALDAAAAALALPAFQVPVPHNAAAGRASAVPTVYTDLITGVIAPAGTGGGPQAPTEVLTTAIPPAGSTTRASAAREGMSPQGTPASGDDSPSTVVLPSTSAAGTTRSMEETSILPVANTHPQPAGDAAAYRQSPASPRPLGGASEGGLPGGTVASGHAPHTAAYEYPQPELPFEPEPLFPDKDMEVAFRDGRPEIIDAPVVRNRSWIKNLLWALVVAAMLAGIALGGWWYGSGRYGEIPVVIGMEPTAARSALSDAGFTLVERENYSDDVPAGQILATSPRGGERYPKGREVTVEISKGQPSVPEIPGSHSLADLIHAAEERTLHVTTGDQVYSDTVAIGGVATIEPPAGSVVRVGDTITAHLSQGPAPVVVPETHGMSVEQATAALKKLGLSAGAVTEEFDDSTIGGSVAATRPAAGQELLRGSSVDLVVSTALKVPDVHGMTEQQAREALSDAGFTVGQIVTDDAAAKSNTVIRTYPGADQLVNPAYTEVDVVLPAKVQVPNVTGKKFSDAKTALEKAGFEVKTTANAGARVVSTQPKGGSEHKPGSTITVKTIG